MGSTPANPETVPWGRRVAAKQQACREAIPNAWRLDQSLLDTLRKPLDKSKNNMIQLNIIERSGILSERDLEITERYNVAELLQCLSSGQITALEATVAFSKRAALAQQLVWSL